MSTAVLMKMTHASHGLLWHCYIPTNCTQCTVDADIVTFVTTLECTFGADNVTFLTTVQSVHLVLKLLHS